MSAPPPPAHPRDFEDLRGRVFNQRYAVSELLSAGRCHVVYGATDRKGAGQVLLRLMRPSLIRDRATVARFEQRVQAARRASSLRARPSIDAGEARDGKLFVVCKRPPGRSLRQYVEEHAHGRLPWPLADALLRSLAEVLAAAHDRRIVHGGMMPDSFWLEEAEGALPVAYVVDLGANPEVRLDGEVAEGSRTTAMTADMEFAAPESIKSGVYDPRTDVYLLGLIAWFMLTGAPPFRGKNHYQVASLQVQQPVPPLRGVVPGIAEEVEGLIGRMLAKEPGARPQTMGEVRGELEAVARGRGMGVVTPVGVKAPALAMPPAVVVPAVAVPAVAVPSVPAMPPTAAVPPSSVTPRPSLGAAAQPPAALADATEVLGVRNQQDAVGDLSETMVLREHEPAASEIERTAAFVAPAAASTVDGPEVTVAWRRNDETTTMERIAASGAPPVVPATVPSEGTPTLTAPLVQSGLTEVLRRGDLVAAGSTPSAPPAPPAPPAASVPIAGVWTPEPVVSGAWLAAEQLRTAGYGAPAPASASLRRGNGARAPAGAVTLPVAWIVVAFLVTVAGGVALGVWLAG